MRLGGERFRVFYVEGHALLYAENMQATYRCWTILLRGGPRLMGEGSYRVCESLAVPNLIASPRRGPKDLIVCVIIRGYVQSYRRTLERSFTVLWFVVFVTREGSHFAAMWDLLVL